MGIDLQKAYGQGNQIAVEGSSLVPVGTHVEIIRSKSGYSLQDGTDLEIKKLNDRIKKVSKEIEQEAICIGNKIKSIADEIRLEEIAKEEEEKRLAEAAKKKKILGVTK